MEKELYHYNPWWEGDFKIYLNILEIVMKSGSKAYSQTSNYGFKYLSKNCSCSQST